MYADFAHISLESLEGYGLLNHGGKFKLIFRNALFADVCLLVALLLLQIGSCTRLSVFSLRENWLMRLPSEIGNCRNLHVLDVSGNR